MGIEPDISYDTADVNDNFEDSLDDNFKLSPLNISTIERNSSDSGFSTVSSTDDTILEYDSNDMSSCFDEPDVYDSMRSPFTGYYSRPTHRYKPDNISDTVEIPEDIPKIHSRSNNIDDDVIDFNLGLIMTNIIGNRVIAIKIIYRNGKEDKKNCDRVIIINTAPAVTSIITPISNKPKPITRYNRSSRSSGVDLLRMYALKSKYRASIKTSSEIPSTFIKTRANNISYIKNRLSKLNTNHDLDK
jgi:hypothetical protein